MKKIILSVGLLLSGAAVAQDATVKAPDFNQKSIDFSIGFNKMNANEIVTTSSYPQPFSVNLGYRKMHNNLFGTSWNLGYDMFSNYKIIPSFSTPKTLYTSSFVSIRYNFVFNLTNLFSWNQFTSKFGCLVHAGPGYGINFNKTHKDIDNLFSFSTGITPQYKYSDKLAIFLDLTSTYNILHNYTYLTNTKNSDRTNILNFNLGVNYYAFGANKDKKHADWTPKGEEANAKLAELAAKLAQAEAKLTDTDKDGVADYLDLEPNTPENSIVNTKGQQVVDTDGDGIVDTEDFCPTVKGSLEFKGCPTGCVAENKPTDELDGQAIDGELKFKIAKVTKDVNFDTKSTSVKSNFKTELDALAKTLKENSNLVVALHGHCDNVGEDVLNNKLSEERAQSVKDYLVSKGVNASRITTKGYGISHPKVSNDTEKGRATNRRVEFIVKSK